VPILRRFNNSADALSPSLQSDTARDLCERPPQFGADMRIFGGLACGQGQ
jgi:hypothetical protein